MSRIGHVEEESGSITEERQTGWPTENGEEMKRKDLFMGTTSIEAQRTIGEIQGLLVRSGALQVLTSYDPKTREPVGLCFTLNINQMTIPFKLPARIDPIYKIINAGAYGRDKAKDMEQAKRVAWRQLYRWIQAQVALIECGMVAAAEVFYPYLQVSPEQTVYERAVTNGLERLAITEQSTT